MSEVRVISVTDAPWHDVRTVFGTRGDPATCWCQYFKMDAATWKTGDAPRFERDLCEQVEGARSARAAGPGLLAYLDDAPVGWVAVEPRPVYSRMLGGRTLPASAETDFSDVSVWAITCFVVRVGFRRRGVSGALLSAAVEHARGGGARVVEAYPVDTVGAKVSSADLFHGALSSFVAAGFDVTGRPAPGRAVVRLVLA